MNDVLPFSPPVHSSTVRFTGAFMETNVIIAVALVFAFAIAFATYGIHQLVAERNSFEDKWKKAQVQTAKLQEQLTAQTLETEKVQGLLDAELLEHARTARHADGRTRKAMRDCLRTATALLNSEAHAELRQNTMLRFVRHFDGHLRCVPKSRYRDIPLDDAHLERLFFLPELGATGWRAAAPCTREQFSALWHELQAMRAREFMQDLRKLSPCIAQQLRDLVQ